MSITFKKILKDIGKDAVKALQKSLEDNDRVATGKTKKSIKYKLTGKNGLVITAADHIMDLEEGKSASDVKSDSRLESQIENWMASRGIPSSALTPILRKLRSSGWNTSRPNRTGRNGGTKGIITDVITDVKEEALDKVSESASDQIIKEIRNGLRNFK